MCVQPGRGVSPPPPKPPVISSYFSFLSSAASGSELNHPSDTKKLYHFKAFKRLIYEIQNKVKILIPA